MFLDDVDYLVEITTYVIYAPCHCHRITTCINIAPQESRTPLMSTHASYRLTGEQGGTRGARGDPGAGTSGRTTELQECPDHKQSTFEKGTPRSILSLPILANLNDMLCLFHYVAFK